MSTAHVPLLTPCGVSATTSKANLGASGVQEPPVLGVEWLMRVLTRGAVAPAAPVLFSIRPRQAWSLLWSDVRSPLLAD